MTDVTRVLVTGASGQVGRALAATPPPGFEVHALARADLDIGVRDAVAKYVRSLRPDVVINAAAYTAVDAAETDELAANRDNHAGALNVALAVREFAETRLLHVSTDFVFAGDASSPYAPDAEPAPLSVYGATKLAGEQAVLRTLERRVLVLRTAWVYSAAGRNFLLTMLRLMRERGAVRVVADQVGTPTSARSVARALWAAAGRPELCGILHWTDAGVASWYDFAVAIAEEAHACGLLERVAAVQPIATADYPTTARRPAYSVLDRSAAIAALGIEPQHWRGELRAVLEELRLA